MRKNVDLRFKGQVPLVGLKEPPISLSFKHVFVVLGFLGFKAEDRRVSNPCFCLSFRGRMR